MLLNKRLPVKYILSGFIPEALLILFLDVISYFILNHYLKDFEIDVPFAIPAFLGTAISVLLSFKMSQSYDRWWEARKVWGAIVNDSRSLIIQLQSFLFQEDSSVVIKKIAYRQIVWCYCLGESLRGLPTSETLSKHLPTEDIENLSRIGNKPLGITQLIAREIKELRKKEHLDSINHIQVDGTLTRLVESMGKAERINTTVFPPKYRLVLRSTIILFCVLLSISLKDFNLVFGVTVLVFLSSIFFLLEHIAVVLQDPFKNRESDTSITAISRTIEINIKQLIDDKDVPPPLAPEKYYLM